MKFLFCPSMGNSNTEVACTHYAILKTVTKIYPEVQVFDNHRQMLKEFPKLKGYDQYL